VIWLSTLLLVADLPFWQKLWNKGVDIAASVVSTTTSAAIIALIATWTWRWKRKRDLRHEADKQRQQHAIGKELLAKENRDREAQLKLELDPLVAKFSEAANTGNADLLQGAWDTWLGWLHQNQLEYIPANRRILDAWAVNAGNFGKANSYQTVSQWAKEIASQVSGTQLS